MCRTTHIKMYSTKIDEEDKTYHFLHFRVWKAGAKDKPTESLQRQFYGYRRNDIVQLQSNMCVPSWPWRTVKNGCVVCRTLWRHGDGLITRCERRKATLRADERRTAVWMHGDSWTTLRTHSDLSQRRWCRRRHCRCRCRCRSVVVVRQSLPHSDWRGELLAVLNRQNSFRI